MFFLIDQNTQNIDIQNIVPQIYCTSTGPSRVKLLVSKFLKPFEYFSSSAYFSAGLAAIACQVITFPLLPQKNSIYYSYASILHITTSALSVYLTSCYAFKYIINKIQPTDEEYNSYLEEYNSYLIGIARNIIVKHPTEAVAMHFVEIRTDRCKADPDVSFNAFIKMLISEYLNLDDPDIKIVDSLLKQLHDDNNDVIDIYIHIHQQCLKKLTAESTEPLFSTIYFHTACKFNCPKKIAPDRSIPLFKMLMENELSALEKRYREIQEVLFKVGLGREISHLIIHGYEDMDTILKKFTKFGRILSETESTSRKLVYFLLNSPYYQDFYKATELVANIPDEQLRTEELAKIISRHPLREEAILSHLESRKSSNTEK